MKTSFYHGITAGALTSLAGIAYNCVYCSYIGAEFATTINNRSIVLISILGCSSASLVYSVCHKYVRKISSPLFNFIFLALTTFSLVFPFLSGYPMIQILPISFRACLCHCTCSQCYSGWLLNLSFSVQGSGFYLSERLSLCQDESRATTLNYICRQKHPLRRIKPR